MQTLDLLSCTYAQTAPALEAHGSCPAALTSRRSGELASSPSLYLSGVAAMTISAAELSLDLGGLRALKSLHSTLAIVRRVGPPSGVPFNRHATPSGVLVNV